MDPKSLGGRVAGSMSPVDLRDLPLSLQNTRHIECSTGVPREKEAIFSDEISNHVSVIAFQPSFFINAIPKMNSAAQEKRL